MWWFVLYMMTNSNLTASIVENFVFEGMSLLEIPMKTWTSLRNYRYSVSGLVLI
jgi:hypothetical protein